MLGQFLEGLSFVAHNFVFASLIALALFNTVFGLLYVTRLPIFADWRAGPVTPRTRSVRIVSDWRGPAPRAEAR